MTPVSEQNLPLLLLCPIGQFMAIFVLPRPLLARTLKSTTPSAVSSHPRERCASQSRALASSRKTRILSEASEWFAWRSLSAVETRIASLREPLLAELRDMVASSCITSADWTGKPRVSDREVKRRCVLLTLIISAARAALKACATSTVQKPDSVQRSLASCR